MELATGVTAEYIKKHAETKKIDSGVICYSALIRAMGKPRKVVLKVPFKNKIK